MTRPRRLFYSLLAAFSGFLLVCGVLASLKMEKLTRERETLADAKRLGFAATQYAQDHKGRYPDAGRWEQEMTPYLGPDAAQIIRPPAPIGGTPRRFSLNPALSGKTEAQVSGVVTPWLFYESVSPTASATDDLDHWPDEHRDGGHLFAVVYGDGHCYLRPPEWKESIRRHLPGL